MMGERQPEGGFATQRLRRAGEFQAVFLQGKRIERPGFIALWHGTPGARKAGFTVSRKVRGAARRNRVRRRLREAYRRSGSTLPHGISVILIGREPAEGAPFDTLMTQMREAILAITRQVGRAGGPADGPGETP